MRLLYALFIQLYYAGLSTAALWNGKAAQWKAGRKNLWAELEQTFPFDKLRVNSAQDRPFSTPRAVVWIHSASAGEFEQAKPVIEALKKHFPQCQVLVTFFSPSGYPSGKKFALADHVFYLPLDTKHNAERFVNTVQPELVLFVKYDFWHHHLKAVHDRNIPLLLVSALFREDQTFFKPHGRFYLRMLHFFTQLFVQDDTSYGLLKKFGIERCTVAGDTRFDRVITIARNFQPVPFIDEFTGGNKTIVAGSTWPDDERMLHGILKKFDGVKIVIAPHEIDKAHVKNIAQLFQKSLLYSTLSATPETERNRKLQEADVLVIDNVGLLSRLYKYATVAYIGGGFNKSGIHNTLEAAVFGKPVIFGPNYRKFREARELIAAGGAFTYTAEAALERLFAGLLSDEEKLKQGGKAAFDYVHHNGGGTEKIMQFIQENRLLTNW